MVFLMPMELKAAPRAIPVSALPGSAWPAALDALVAAFAHDPVATFLFPDPEQRRIGMRHLFEVGFKFARHYGYVDVTPDQTAVAVWVRPEFTGPSWWRLLRSGILGMAFKLGWRATLRLLRYKEFLDTVRMAALPSPHWFLFSIGVRPDQQGRGLGAALLAHGRQRMNARQTCYLETANPDNLAFYRRNGFRVISDQLHPRTGPGIWSLVATAQSTSAAEGIAEETPPKSRT